MVTDVDAPALLNLLVTRADLITGVPVLADAMV